MYRTNEVPGSGAGSISYRTAYPMNAPVRTVLFEGLVVHWTRAGEGGGALRGGGGWRCRLQGLGLTLVVPACVFVHRRCFRLWDSFCFLCDIVCGHPGGGGSGGGGDGG